ncbi:translation initiation factor IF-2-like [Cebus imitator]|uniref:translation initiation factor IF-2-like n=1 Tax=Cebus imitator TaxID=2715852 RepID=UPI00080A20ED|nr:translation initiation factor IF-2-like [Cebus imitator]
MDARRRGGGVERGGREAGRRRTAPRRHSGRPASSPVSRLPETKKAPRRAQGGWTGSPAGGAEERAQGSSWPPSAPAPDLCLRQAPPGSGPQPPLTCFLPPGRAGGSGHWSPLRKPRHPGAPLLQDSARREGLSGDLGWAWRGASNVGETARMMTRPDLRPEIDERPPALSGDGPRFFPSCCGRHRSAVLFPAPPVGNNLRNQLNRLALRARRSLELCAALSRGPVEPG